MSKEDRKIWLINEQGQKFFIYETEKCDMEKELNETIQRLQKRIEELEEENKIYRRQLNSAFDRGFIHKNKIINLLKTRIIEYDCEDCITGKFVEVKDIKELLKDGGE